MGEAFFKLQIQFHGFRTIRVTYFILFEFLVDFNFQVIVHFFKVVEFMSIKLFVAFP